MKKTYTGDELNYVGFPLGGLGAGSFCVEGTGAFSAFSLKNEPDLNLEPPLFAAVTVKGETPVSRVIEGQVPKYKIFGGARGETFREEAAVCDEAVLERYLETGGWRTTTCGR